MIKNFLRRLSGGPRKPDAAQAQSAFSDTQLAVAALLVEAAKADGDYETRECAMVDRALEKRFQLTIDEARRLRAEGEARQEKARDLFQFSRIVKETMSEAEKIDLVEALWEVIYADGVRDAHEDYVVRRLIGLIYVSDKDSGAARRRVMARLGLDQ